MEGSLPDFRDLKTGASAVIADPAPVSTPPPAAAGCRMPSRGSEEAMRGSLRLLSHDA